MHLIYEWMLNRIDLNSFELRRGRKTNLFGISSLQADAFVVQLDIPPFCCVYNVIRLAYPRIASQEPTYETTSRY